VDEQSWLHCTDPVPLLKHLGEQASPRRLLLFKAACCRLAWRLLVDERSRRAVEVTERFADGAADEAEHLAARAGPWEAVGLAKADGFATAVTKVSPLAAGLAALAASECVSCPPDTPSYPSASDICSAEAVARGAQAAIQWQAYEAAPPAEMPERSVQADLLRCIFGNPFRPLPGRTFPGYVRALAEACSAAFPGQAPERGVLADALADLGEDDAAEHLRQGTHVKGCHVLDWVLARG
jgi:hypothetical protein